MRGWCHVISLAHQFKTGMEFNYPHWALLWRLDKALTCVKAEGCSARGGGQDETESRDQDQIRQTIHNQQPVTYHSNGPKERKGRTKGKASSHT